MKRLKILLVALIGILLVACEGSDTYRGIWKATNTNGEKFVINFLADSFNVTDSLGEIKDYSYSQNTINVTNGVETYGIIVKGGGNYLINFPIANDESVGYIMDGNGVIMYTISRDDYIYYEDVYKLK